MTEFIYILQILTQPQVIALSAGPIIVTVALISGAWSRIRRAEMDTALKLELVKRGMSSAEIVEVLAASSRK